MKILRFLLRPHGITLNHCAVEHVTRTLQLLDQLGELVVEEHLLGRWENRLWLLGCPRIQLVFGDEAQFFNKVLLSNALLDELLQLFSEEDRDDTKIGHSC